MVGWWYRKAAVFYLPPGWLGPLGWWLALPFAPAGVCFPLEFSRLTERMGWTGSVSVGVWQMACKRVLKVGERVVRELSAGACSSALIRAPAMGYSQG